MAHTILSPCVGPCQVLLHDIEQQRQNKSHMHFFLEHLAKVRNHCVKDCIITKKIIHTSGSVVLFWEVKFCENLGKSQWCNMPCTPLIFHPSQSTYSRAFSFVLEVPFFFVDPIDPFLWGLGSVFAIKSVFILFKCCFTRKYLYRILVGILLYILKAFESLYN